MNTTTALDKLEILLEEAHRTSLAIRFDKNKLLHRSLMALNGTVLELSGGCSTLLRSGDATCTPVVLRSLLEAYVDVVNLSSSEDYLHKMSAAHLTQSLRLAANANEAKENPYLEDLAGRDTLKTDIAAMKNSLSKLKQQGFSSLSIYQRFRLADEVERYVSVYAHLCMHSHSNLNALEQRHIAKCDDDFQIVYCRPTTEDESARYIDTVAGIVANSVLFVKERIEGVRPSTTRIETALASLRRLYE